MTYTKTNWQDHIVEYPNRYRQVQNPDGSITLAKDPGNVVQQGTPLSATNLNKIEQGIADAHDQIGILSSVQYYVESYPRQGSETDDGARINRAIQDVYNKGGGILVFKQGTTYTTSVPIMMKQGVILDLNFSTIKAIAPMTAVIDSDVNTALTDPRIYRGYVDATDKANWALWLRYFKIGWIEDVYVLNGLSGGIKLGSNASTQNSYGLHARNLNADRPRGTRYSSAPSGSIGIYLERCTDNVLFDCNAIGYETGLKLPTGASGNLFYNMHNWARIPDNIMVTGFDIGGTDNFFFNCQADTCAKWGFYVRNWRNFFTNCKNYNNDNYQLISPKPAAFVGFHFTSGTKYCTVLGTDFTADSSIGQITKDVEFGYPTYPAWSPNTAYNVGTRVTVNGNIYQCVIAGTSGTTAPSETSTGLLNITDGTVTWQYVDKVDSSITPYGNNITVIGSTWTYTSTKTVYNPIAFSMPDNTTNLDLVYARNGLPVWKSRTDTSNDYVIAQYDPNTGDYQANAITIDRTNYLVKIGDYFDAGNGGQQYYFVPNKTSSLPAPNGKIRGAITRVQDDVNGDRFYQCIRLGSSGHYWKQIGYIDSGTTAQRPVNVPVGYCYFDTTLGKPIWCKVSGSTPTWVDATGATV